MSVEPLASTETPISPAESVVVKQLQCCFNEVQNQHMLISKIILDSLQTIESLVSLVNQLSCCKKVNFKTTPLCEFEDISNRLEYKIVGAIEEKLSQISADLSRMHEGFKGVKKLADASMKAYNRFSDELTVEVLMKGEPTRPSIAQMLEWTQDAQLCFHKEHAKRKQLLNKFSYSDEKAAKELQKEWKITSHLKKLREEILPMVSFFIREEIG